VYVEWVDLVLFFELVDVVDDIVVGWLVVVCMVIEYLDFVV